MTPSGELHTLIHPPTPDEVGQDGTAEWAWAGGVVTARSGQGGVELNGGPGVDPVDVGRRWAVALLAAVWHAQDTTHGLFEVATLDLGVGVLLPERVPPQVHDLGALPAPEVVDEPDHVVAVWEGGEISTVPGSHVVCIDGEPHPSAAVHRFALCLLAATARAATRGGHR